MKTKFVMGLLAGAALLVSAAGADAKVIQLKVTTNGGSTVQNFAGTTFSGNTASTTASGTIGSVVYSISGSTAATPNDINVGLDTTSHNTSNTATFVTYYVTVTGLTPQPSVQDWEDLFSGANASIAIPSTHTVDASTVKVYYDPANHAFAGVGPGSTATLLYSSGGGCGSTASFTCAGGGPLTLGATPFSLTEVITVAYKSNSAGGVVTANNLFSAVPEPTSLAVLGSGLLLAGLMFRRRRNGKSA